MHTIRKEIAISAILNPKQRNNLYNDALKSSKEKLNLERARAAALAGDQVTLAKELSNQGMTLSKFQNMNVVAQESYAKALGLSADELSDQLRKQKIAQEQGKSLAEAHALFGNLEQYNIYRKMAEWNWKGTLEDAFRKMYL